MALGGSRLFRFFLLLVSLWCIVGYGTLFLLSSSQDADLQTKPDPVFTQPTLTHPYAEPGTYCGSYDSSRLSKKTMWSDRPSAYAVTKLQDFGWKLLSPKSQANVRVLSKPGKYSDIRTLSVNALRDYETPQGLFFAPEESIFIFTRMYHYRDDNQRNLQSARLGIDYACPSQLFNHVPGASAFCRKDYLQYYLRDYTSRYEAQGLGHCYQQSITPTSYILSLPSHCEKAIEVLREKLEQFEGSQKWTLEFITKDAVRHKGYGIKLVTQEYAQELVSQYSKDGSFSCSALRPKDQSVIMQQYISSPALIEGRKFDFRVFALIANVDPLVALWAPDNGHTRVSDRLFNGTSTEFTQHITANVNVETEAEFEFLKEHRFNLPELAEYFQARIGDSEKWLKTVAHPAIKKILIHMFRAAQQNFLVKRKGLFEFYGVDFLMSDTLQDFYLLEANRRPDVQEKNPKLQYREDMLLKDISTLAEWYQETHFHGDFDELYERLDAFVPLIDESRDDPYFGALPLECAVPFTDMNLDLPVDPMLEPLAQHLGLKYKTKTDASS